MKRPQRGIAKAPLSHATDVAFANCHTDHEESAKYGKEHMEDNEPPIRTSSHLVALRERCERNRNQRHRANNDIWGTDMMRTNCVERHIGGTASEYRHQRNPRRRASRSIQRSKHNHYHFLREIPRIAGTRIAAARVEMIMVGSAACKEYDSALANMFLPQLERAISKGPVRSKPNRARNGYG